MKAREIIEMIISYVTLLLLVSRFNISQMELFAIPLLTAFIFHELGHRYVAHKLGFHAEFKLWTGGLILAFALFLITDGRFFLFVPGAVVVGERKASSYVYEYATPDGVINTPVYHSSPNPTDKEMGLIATAGPIVNLIFASIFLLAYTFYPATWVAYSFLVNDFIALFNLLPIPPLDGSKIITWDKKMWLSLFLVSLAMLLGAVLP